MAVTTVRGVAILDYFCLIIINRQSVTATKPPTDPKKGEPCFHCRYLLFAFQRLPEPRSAQRGRWLELNHHRAAASREGTPWKDSSYSSGAEAERPQGPAVRVIFSVQEAFLSSIWLLLSLSAIGTVSQPAFVRRHIVPTRAFRQFFWSINVGQYLPSS